MAGYVLWLGRLKKRQYVVTIIRFYAVEAAGSCRPPVTVNTALQIWKELVCGMTAAKRLRPSL